MPHNDSFGKQVFQYSEPHMKLQKVYLLQPIPIKGKPSQCMSMYLCKRQSHVHMYTPYMYLIEEVESVDVILMENKFDELASAVQVDRFELTRLERK